MRIVNFGDVMNQLFKKQGKRIDRDHMRRQDVRLQAKVQQEAARKISRMKNKTTLIVDTHMFVKTRDGIWPGTPRRVLETIDPDLIVIIEADPEEIADRRSSDSSRKRDRKSAGDVKSETEWSRYMASANSVLSGAPIQIVNNREGRQRKAAETLLQIIERLV